MNPKHKSLEPYKQTAAKKGTQTQSGCCENNVYILFAAWTKRQENKKKTCELSTINRHIFFLRNLQVCNCECEEHSVHLHCEHRLHSMRYTLFSLLLSSQSERRSNTGDPLDAILSSFLPFRRHISKCSHLSTTISHSRALFFTAEKVIPYEKFTFTLNQ